MENQKKDVKKNWCLIHPEIFHEVPQVLFSLDPKKSYKNVNFSMKNADTATSNTLICS